MFLCNADLENLKTTQKSIVRGLQKIEHAKRLDVPNHVKMASSNRDSPAAILAPSHAFQYLATGATSSEVRKTLEEHQDRLDEAVKELDSARDAMHTAKAKHNVLKDLLEDLVPRKIIELDCQLTVFAENGKRDFQAGSVNGSTPPLDSLTVFAKQNSLNGARYLSWCLEQELLSMESICSDAEQKHSAALSRKNGCLLALVELQGRL